VGFRPEKILISRNQTSLENPIPGVIEQITYTGSLTHTTVRIATDRRLHATSMNFGDGAVDGPAQGDAVFVGLPSGAGVILTE
jgi:hypothetical protein